MKFSSFQLYRIIGAAFVVLQIFTFVAAQDVDLEIVLDIHMPSARVTGRFTDVSPVANRRNLAFARAVAGDAELGRRISSFEIFNGSGEPIANRKLMDGEYLASEDFTSWRYTVDLSAPTNPSAYAHRSWIKGDLGVLMTDDLLPQFGSPRRPLSARTRIVLPDGWRISTSATREANGSFLVSNIRDGVFVIGSGLRFVTNAEARMPELTVSGERPFTDDEARQMTDEIFGEYLKLFRKPPHGVPHLMLLRFPDEIPPGVWEAEARGETVIVMSSDMPFRSQSLQRLHEQLRHELFHLWVPNSLELTGDYAWFYEGAALYQSLKTGVAVNRIRFDDLLDTLSRAYAIDARQRPRRPLVENGSVTLSRSNTELYARGIVIAFMLDIRLLSGAKGRKDFGDLLSELFAKHGTGSETTGSGPALAALMGDTLISRYVTGNEPIDWTPELKMAGLATVDERSGALSVMGKLSGEQKRMLDELGYNNWRRSTRRNRK